MGYLNLDEDTSKYPDKVPQGYFRKERAPEGALAKLWWSVKNRPLIAFAIFALPIVIFGTFLFASHMTQAPDKAPTPALEQGKSKTGSGFASDLIEIHTNPNAKPEEKKTSAPLPLKSGSGSESGKDD